uniref:LysR family transcriptional regulator n=1 Tax=Pararhizobium sp. IMCC3301 TaxID=3067904 RepID=UPI00274250B0|nr:LysR family transcriptional regulator [Pararhizobium sp. IMCC3301]
MDTLTRMRTFIAVVDEDGFSAAGRALGRSKALVSKYVSELEDELGVRLLNRTTRKLSLTEIGHSYFHEAQSIIHQVDMLQETVQDKSGKPRGLLRLSAPRSLADSPLMQTVMGFAESQPDVSLELVLEDRFVDLIQEAFDVAIRITSLEDSSLIARRLGSFRIVTCASPEVLSQYGEVKTPADLIDRPCLIDSNQKSRQSWTYVDQGKRLTIPVKGRVETNSPQAVRLAALASLGFARTLHMLVEEDLKQGRLVKVLDEFEAEDRGIFVVYANRRHLSSKIRAFVDYMSKNYQRNGD